jgi:drug/metabolite transporter (DMT)-like permease
LPSRSRWLRASLLGGCLFGVHQLFFFSTIKLTSIVNVTVIGALQPLLVLLVAGPMFGEHPTRAGLLWSVVALGGTALVVGSSAGAPSWSAAGDTLAVLNLFAFTAYFLASKRARARVGAPEYVIGMTTVAGIVVFVAALLTGQDLTPPGGADAAILLGIALVPGTLGHVLTNWAHAHVPAFVMSIMLLAVPVIASVAATVFLAEALTVGHAVGGGLVLVAIARVLRSTSAGASKELAAGAARTDAP